jgi:hypothetical protein
MSISDQKQPRYPWFLDANDRYREVVRSIIGFSTAALVVPFFFLKSFPIQPVPESIGDLLSWEVYLSWAFLGLAIILGFLYYYASAAWVWIAWGQDAYFFGKVLEQDGFKKVDTCLRYSFWGCAISFGLGIVFALWYIKTYPK